MNESNEPGKFDETTNDITTSRVIDGNFDDNSPYNGIERRSLIISRRREPEFEDGDSMFEERRRIVPDDTSPLKRLQNLNEVGSITFNNRMNMPKEYTLESEEYTGKEDTNSDLIGLMIGLFMKIAEHSNTSEITLIADTHSIITVYIPNPSKVEEPGMEEEPGMGIQKQLAKELRRFAESLKDLKKEVKDTKRIFKKT